MHGRVQPDLLLPELQGSLRVRAGDLELAAMGGDHCDRQMDPRHLEPVLDVELVSAIGVLGRELPAAAPELDIGEPGERVRGQQLVALMPFLVLALDERTRLVHGSCAPRARARSRPFALCSSLASPTADARSCARAACAGASGSPTAQPRNARMASASTRSASSSRSSAIASAARACSRRPDEPLLEAGRPREPALDDGLQRRPRRRLAQGLLEQHDGLVEALELGEEQESLGAQRADVAFRQQVGRDRPGARPFSGRAMRTSCSQGATTAIVVLVRRRQPKRLLGELGSDGRCAALGRERGGILEHGGGGGVRSVAREREVTRAEERVLDDPRNSSVNASSLVAQVEVENRRQQRVREANRAVLALDHVRGECRRERVGRNTCPLQKRLRRRPQRRGERERVARHRGKSGEPRADELVQPLRNRKRLERVDVHLENACQLQREERIAARPLVDAEQRLAGERPPETVVQQPMERADAERSNRHAARRAPHPAPAPARTARRRRRAAGRAAREPGSQRVFAARTQARSTRTRRATERRRPQAESASAR